MYKTNDPHQKDRRKILRNNMTPAEKEIWNYLRGRQFLGMKFRRQFGVGPYILDFYTVENKVCLEIDGDSHFSEEGKTYDRERTEFLNSQGIQVIRYTNQEIYESIFEVLEDLKRKVQNTPPNLP